MLHASISILLASDASTGFVSNPKSCKSAIISPSDFIETAVTAQSSAPWNFVLLKLLSIPAETTSCFSGV